MPRLKITTKIKAPPETCFDLSRDLDFHVRSLEHTGERAVSGRTSGLIELGEEVTWRGRHFGLEHEHTSRITAFDRPRHFRDEMVTGRFKSFVHDHYFEPTPDGTRVIDILEFTTPCGPLGRLVDLLVLTRYMRKLLRTRNSAVKAEAERRLRSG